MFIIRYPWLKPGAMVNNVEKLKNKSFFSDNSPCILTSPDGRGYPLLLGGDRNDSGNNVNKYA